METTMRYMGPYYKIPKAICYLLKGDYKAISLGSRV